MYEINYYFKIKIRCLLCKQWFVSIKSHIENMILTLESNQSGFGEYNNI